MHFFPYFEQKSDWKESFHHLSSIFFQFITIKMGQKRFYDWRIDRCWSSASFLCYQFFLDPKSDRIERISNSFTDFIDRSSSKHLKTSALERWLRYEEKKNDESKNWCKNKKKSSANIIACLDRPDLNLVKTNHRSNIEWEGERERVTT